MAEEYCDDEVKKEEVKTALREHRAQQSLFYVAQKGMVALVAWVVPGFTISSFWTAVGAAIIVSIVSWAASGLIGSSGKFEKFPASR